MAAGVLRGEKRGKDNKESERDDAMTTKSPTGSSSSHESPSIDFEALEMTSALAVEFTAYVTTQARMEAVARVKRERAAAAAASASSIASDASTEESNSQLPHSSEPPLEEVTIGPSDIVAALNRLGYGGYASRTEAFVAAERERATASVASASASASASGSVAGDIPVGALGASSFNGQPARSPYEALLFARLGGRG